MDAGSNSFYCKCEATGYTGENCNTLVIDVPNIPTVTVNSPYTVLISASPDRAFPLRVVSDELNNVIVTPPSLMISPRSTYHNISVMVHKPGLYKIYFIIDDDTINYEPIPPATVLATNDFNDAKCPKKKYNGGMLTPGCCQADETELGLNSLCPPSPSSVLINSTCGWSTDNNIPYSAGIIFSSNNGFSLPIAMAGAQFQSKDGYMHLNSITASNFDSDEPKCFKSNVGNVGNPSDICETKSLSIKDIWCSLEYDSLAFTYLHQTMSLVPKWLRIKALQSDRIHDVNSYMVKLVHSDNFDELEECDGLFALSDGLYAVLIYTGSLEGTINKETKQLHPSKSAMCFAVNLCEGARTPLYITTPGHIHYLLQSYSFMQDLKFKGWKVNTFSISISSSEIDSVASRVTQQSYWNGYAKVMSEQSKPHMVANMKFSKVLRLISRSATAELDFSGDAHFSHVNFDQVSCTKALQNFQ